MPYKDPEKQKAYNKEYQKEWYKRNKKAHKINTRKNTKIHRKKMAIFASDYKAEQGCCRCPENDPVCLDFHHTGDNKEIDVSVAIAKAWSQKRIQKEMDKCIIICANCHRKLHASIAQ